MKIFTAIMQQLSAAKLRRYMKRKRKSKGLSIDLKALVSEYRMACPEYADQLERLIFPKLKIDPG